MPAAYHAREMKSAHTYLLTSYNYRLPIPLAYLISHHITTVFKATYQSQPSNPNPTHRPETAAAPHFFVRRAYTYLRYLILIINHQTGTIHVSAPTHLALQFISSMSCRLPIFIPCLLGICYISRYTCIKT